MLVALRRVYVIGWTTLWREKGFLVWSLYISIIFSTPSFMASCVFRVGCVVDVC
jgi:hypothetical protein